MTGLSHKQASRKRRLPSVATVQSPGQAAPGGLFAAALRVVPLFSMIAIAFLVIPLTKDPFRFPKDLLVRAEAIVLIACWILLAIRGARPPVKPLDRPVMLLAAATLLWTAVTALFAANRALSVPALAWAVAVVVVLVSTYLALAERRRLSDLWFLLAPALVNAVIAILQQREIWSPFRFAPDTPPQMKVTALIGNPNDAGTYLAGPVLIAVVCAVTIRKWRWVYVTAAVVLLLGLMSTGTATAIIGCGVGLAAIVFTGLRHRKSVIIGLVTAAVLALVMVAALGGIGRDDVASLRRVEVLNETLSFRLPPFFAAWRMFLNRPLIGVGPGCSGSMYFDYKIAVERDYPTLFHSGQGWSNFGEVHNDHLEILAETGAPGYILFLLVLVFVASHSFRRRSDGGEDDSDLQRVARLVAFPAAAAFFVICLAQFPLQISSATSSFGFAFAASIGWLRR